MRCWDAPEKADILVILWFFFNGCGNNLSRAIKSIYHLHTNTNQVSELLGSFGDNELSPECLDGAQRFLKPDGISIPSSYWTLIHSYLSWIPYLCIYFLNSFFMLSCHLIFLLVVLYRYTSFIQPITASKLHNDVGVYHFSIAVPYMWNLRWLHFCRSKHTKILHILKLHMSSSYTA